MPRILAIVGLFATALAALADHSEQAALPSLDTIIKQAVEHSKKEPDNDRLFRQRYEFIRTRITEYRNGDGALTKREQKTNVNQVRIASTTAVTKPKPTPAVTSPKLQSQTKPKDPNRVDKNDILLNEDLVGRFQFTLIGREDIGGRSALVLDFKPANKKLPNNNFKDRFINIAAGRLWVDEEDAALVKANLHLTERVNVIGGIVGAVGKFSCTLDRGRTPDGLWFTRAMDWHLEGRALLAHRTIDYHEEKTGVRINSAR
jgi:hypothetical protein